MRFEHRAVLGSRLLRHADRVACVRWSRDGRSMATGAWDGTVAWWDAQTGERQETWTGHVGPVHAVDIDHRSGSVLSCGEDGTLRRWSRHGSAPSFALLVSSGPLYALRIDAGVAHLGGADGAIHSVDVDAARILPGTRVHDAATDPVAISIDHRFTMQRRGSEGLVIWETDSPETIVATVGRSARLVAGAAGTSVVTFPGRCLAFHSWPRQVTGLAVSVDGTHLYTCGQDGGVRSWDLSGPHTSRWFARDAGLVHALDVDPRDGTIVTAGDDGCVRTYRDEVGAGVVQVSAQPLLAVCVSRGTVFSAGQDTHIHVIESEIAGTGGPAEHLVPATGTDRPADLRGHFWHVTTLDPHPTEALLASASKDYTIRIWWTVTGREVTPRIDAPDDYIDAVAWVHDDDAPSVLAGSEDGSVRRWWMNGRMELVARMEGQVHAIALPPGGAVAMAADDRGGVTAIDLRSGDTWCVAPPEGHGSGFLAMSGTEVEGCAVAVGVRRTGEVCQLTAVRSGAGSQSVLGHVSVGPMTSAAISPDGTRVAVGDRSGTVATYRVDASAGSLVGTGEDHLHEGDWVTSLAWSSDGAALVSGGWDRSGWLRRGASPPIRLRGHHETIRVCAFDHADATCVTGSWDGMLHAWDAEDGVLRAWAEVEGRAVSITVLAGDRSTLVATGNADTTVSIIELLRENAP